MRYRDENVDNNLMTKNHKMCAKPDRRINTVSCPVVGFGKGVVWWDQALISGSIWSRGSCLESLQIVIMVLDYYRDNFESVYKALFFN